MIYRIHRLLRLKGMTNRFFFWVTVLVILTSALYVLVFIVIDKNHRINDATDKLQFELHNQHMIIENWVHDRLAEVRLFANFPVSKDGSIDIMATRFKFFHTHHKQFDSIVYIDKSGDVIIDTAAEQIISENRKINLKDRDYFKAAKSGKEYITDTAVSSNSQEPVIILSSPIIDDSGDFQGVVFGATYFSKLNQYLSQTIHSDTSEVMLINDKGKVLSSAMCQKESLIEGANNTFNVRLYNIIKNDPADNGVITFDQSEHGESLIAYTSLFDDRYYLVNKISKQEILAPHIQLIMLMITIGLLIIFIGFVIVIPVSKQLGRPFVSLVEATKQMRAGQYQTRIDPEKFTTSPTELQLLMHSFNDMAASVYKSKQTLKELSNTDGLTGIANRRYFEDRLEEIWQKAVQNKTPTSLIFVDVDYFKKYNDQFGHLMGDSCLIQLAHAMKSAVGTNDYLLARYGGEEFVVTMPNTSKGNAQKLAEEIRQEVSNLQIRRTKDQSNQYVTVSLGVATVIPTDTMTKEDLIQLADQSLYEAKSAGRNQVIVKEKDQDKHN